MYEMKMSGFYFCGLIMMNTLVMEPFRIKSVELINFMTVKERKRILEDANYNLFKIKSQEVQIDLLTDSGTSAMSSEQWSGIMKGDETYAGSSSFYRFEEAVRNITGDKYIIPTHQGRATERIIFSVLGGNGKSFVANSFFDTTRGNIELAGSQAIDLPAESGMGVEARAPFKGNIDVIALKRFIQDNGKENIPLVVLTVTNNTLGGQPVSLKNIKEVSQVCKQYGIPLFLDACRFAENAYFIKLREEGYGDKSVISICREMFSLADGSIMSAKKDGLSNTGGWLSMMDEQLAEKCKNIAIITEGFTTYGGMTGRDMETIARGLEEAVDEKYLEYRIKSTEYLGQKLLESGIPILEPPGGHAIYLDAKRFAPHIPSDKFPGQAIACQLYLEGGIRSCEVGSVMFGKTDLEGNFIPAPMELVRLAIPRRVYTISHLDYTAHIIQQVYKHRYQLKGLEFLYAPLSLRHFTAQFQKVTKKHQTRQIKLILFKGN